MTENLLDIIGNSTLIVHPDEYGYGQFTQRPDGDFFMVSQDTDEVTIIATRQQLAELSPIAITGWYKLLEIRCALPFLAKGFLAAITRAVADHQLNILIVSTYSKDYALVKTETADQAIQALSQLGFPTTHYAAK